MAGLTPTENEIAKALSGVRISDLSEAEFGLFMNGLIHKTHLNCGFKVDKIAVDATIDELIVDLRKYNATLTKEEITIAFQNGYKKEYGDFFGLNNATYFQWVNAYTWGEKRLRVKKKLLLAKENEGKEPEKKSAEEVDYIMQDACIKAFDDFRRGALIFDGGNVKYKYLFKKGLLKLTDELRAELKKMAEEKLRQEVIDSKGKVETIEKALSRVTPETVQSEARKLALLQYFKELADAEFELKDILL